MLLKYVIEQGVAAGKAKIDDGFVACGEWNIMETLQRGISDMRVEVVVKNESASVRMLFKKFEEQVGKQPDTQKWDLKNDVAEAVLQELINDNLGFKCDFYN
jgi:hypothetical protein